MTSRGRKLAVGTCLVQLGLAVCCWAAEPVGGEAVSATPIAADSPRDSAELFLAATAAYDAGDWAAAIAGYDELIERGPASAAIYFNLGSAQLRHGDLGQAIASFRRGRSLAPRDGDLEANLRYARQSIKDAIAPPEPSPVLSTLLFWHYRLSRSELLAILLVVNLALWTVATIRIFRPQGESLKWLAVLLAIIFLLIGGSWCTRSFLARPVAVIVPQEVDAFTAPDAESTVRFKLHAGTELRVEDERTGWIRIVLPDGQQGWVESEWVELVTG